jgi:glycine betaine/proline transport system permease protein
MEWLTKHKIPLGHWIDNFVIFLQDNATWFFDIVSDGLRVLIEGLISVMAWTPPLLLVALFAAIGYALHRSWRLVAMIVVSLLLVINLGYWEATIETLALVIFSTAVCMLIGVPVGIAAAHRPWLYTAIRPVLDLMQTIPTFVYLIPTLIFFGLGVVPGLISTVIFAIPAPVRLTHLGISSVPKQLMEAGESFGATHHGRPHAVHHAIAVDGGDRRAGRGERPGQAGGARS